jgi:hypothetical protein
LPKETAKNNPGAIIYVQCLHVKSLVPSGKAKSQMGIQFWIPFSMKRNFTVLRETKKNLTTQILNEKILLFSSNKAGMLLFRYLEKVVCPCFAKRRDQ